MTIYKIIFSICTMLYVFFSAKIFLSFRKNKITTLFNTLFFTFGLITINQINNNHFIFILENIIIILFLFLGGCKGKRWIQRDVMMCGIGVMM